MGFDLWLETEQRGQRSIKTEVYEQKCEVGSVWDVCGENKEQVSLLKLEKCCIITGIRLECEISVRLWKTFECQGKKYDFILWSVVSHSTFWSSRNIGLKKLLKSFFLENIFPTK